MSAPDRRRARAERIARARRGHPPIVVTASGNDRSDVAVEILLQLIAEHRARERG